MAELVSDEKVAQPEQQAEPEKLPISPFRPHDEAKLARRFGLAYFILAALVGAGVGFLIVALGRSNHSAKPAAGPSFLPALYTGQSGPRQIADAVSKQYRLPSGKYLVAVPYAGTPKLQTRTQDVRISAVVVRGSGISGETLQVTESSTSVMYILCGLGTACSIREGKPSIARGELLRREALDLTLKTFKFMPGIESVIEFMPPPPNSAPNQVLFFRRSDLAKEIPLPLSATLEPHKKLVPGSLNQSEVDTIVALTAPRVFAFNPNTDFSTLVDGSAALVLSPAT